MKVLALDLGSATGWAIGPSFVSGVWRNKAGRYDGGGMRYLRFRAWLSEIKDTAGPFDAVFFEEVRGHKGTDAAHVYGGLLAHLTAWCEEHSIPYEGIPVGTIKRAATGKGNSGKPEMIKAATARVGHPITDDNEADAICLLAYVNSTRLPNMAARKRVQVKK